MEAKKNYGKLVLQKLPVWRYTKPDGMHNILIYHLKNNIYLMENRGIAYQEGCSLAFDFVLDTVKDAGGKICCLMDNSKLASIDWSFKLLFLKFPLANECFDKIATVGDNLYVKSFARIYQYTFSRKFKIRSFQDKAMALDWLERP